MAIVVRAVLIGMLIMLAGTIPRNILFGLNMRFFTAVPWAAVLIALYIWLFWCYLAGVGPPSSTAAERRAALRANALPAKLWAWSLLAGALGIVALVLGLRLLNRLVLLPQQELPDLSHVPFYTIATLLLVAAPVAGIIEEASFRGYMQGPIERRLGIVPAVLITGTMFALAHLDFTPILWPYYVAVAAIYGATAYLTNSILPAIVLHSFGNLYSNFDIWLRGRAEWQAPSGSAELIWRTGADMSFWTTAAAFVSATILAFFAYWGLARAARGRAAL